MLRDEIPGRLRTLPRVDRPHFMFHYDVSITVDTTPRSRNYFIHRYESLDKETALIGIAEGIRDPILILKEIQQISTG